MSDANGRLAHAIKLIILIACAGLLAAIIVAPRAVYRASAPLRALVRPVTNFVLSRESVEERMEQVSPDARRRLRPHFEGAGVGYPPDEVRLVGLKRERRLEVYARESGGEYTQIVTYPIVAASGELGPKLRRGDEQVPEGVYDITALNPNSWFYLSLRVSYPNAMDRRRGEEDGREELGDDIYVHGGGASVGCLAMGDEVAEELFVLAADVGLEDVDIVIAPADLRETPPAELLTEDSPTWLDERYRRIRAALPRR
jgi:hypothetical protein